MASAGPSRESWVKPAAPPLHSIREADARYLSSLCELLVNNEQSCDRGVSLSWPSGVCRGPAGDVGATVVFDDPNDVAGSWLAVSPIVADMGRQNFTNLQIHLNSDSPEHTNQGDVPPSAFLVFGDFGGGAFRLCPPGRTRDYAVSHSARLRV